ncbi:unnamed protein product [Vitrella brassicaformis CCMP3155]|uniref:Rhodanese domain-containing protein n=1 Tax=Vitrella brassicaformis (strain CCMP3155) TaxID=1169540 RepID=A0A0G4F6M2_VITBC|nr:unnamed protein product [Vitrella brassicaformis CCMP3155]|eukprot:CEM08071.1 unnamed protein product [Vitrella brassicaformis CCMP3155]
MAIRCAGVTAARCARYSHRCALGPAVGDVPRLHGRRSLGCHPSAFLPEAPRPHTFFVRPSAARRWFSAKDGAESEVPVISKEELKDVIAKGCKPAADESFVIVDVRDPWEIRDHGKIDNAVNIPLADIPTAFHFDDEAWEDRFDFPKPKSSDTLVFYCRAGIRAESAAKLAQREGFKVRHYKGSYIDWFGKTYPIGD